MSEERMNGSRTKRLRTLHITKWCFDHFFPPTALFFTPTLFSAHATLPFDHSFLTLSFTLTRHFLIILSSDQPFLRPSFPPNNLPTAILSSNYPFPWPTLFLQYLQILLRITPPPPPMTTITFIDLRYVLSTDIIGYCDFCTKKTECPDQEMD